MKIVLSATGCPSNYRIGPSIILWIILIISAFSFGIYYLIKMFRTSLINKKEMYLGGGVIAIGRSLCYLLLQIGIIFQEQYQFFLSLYSIVIASSSIPLFHFWEKNLTSLKKIPTILIFINTASALINFIYYLIFGFELYPNFTILLLTLGIIIVTPFFFLTIDFTKKVVGKLRFYGIVIIFAYLLDAFALFLDHPPGCLILPASSILSPIFFIISGFLIIYGLIGIIDGMSSYYKQTQICIIHKGKILSGENIYYCPSCTTVYCHKCYEQVIKRDGCWNCQEKVKTKDEGDWEYENIPKIDVEKDFKKEKSG